MVSAILGTLYMAYIIYYSVSAFSAPTDAATAVGTGLGIALITPHIICVILAVIFNWIGWSGSVRWSALVGGILYSVSALLMLIYLPFVLLQLILSFVGYANLKKLNSTHSAGMAG